MSQMEEEAGDQSGCKRGRGRISESQATFTECLLMISSITGITQPLFIKYLLSIKPYTRCQRYDREQGTAIDLKVFTGQWES